MYVLDKSNIILLLKTENIWISSICKTEVIVLFIIVSLYVESAFYDRLIEIYYFMSNSQQIMTSL